MENEPLCNRAIQLLKQIAIKTKDNMDPDYREALEDARDFLLGLQKELGEYPK